MFIPAHGWCSKCETEHRLGAGRAQHFAQTLMQDLATNGRLDDSTTEGSAETRFPTDYLFGPARGQMFGVLECRDPCGETVVLRAFSCQYNGVWTITGWCPPVFDLATYGSIMTPADKQIKELTRQMAAAGVAEAEITNLKHARKNLSRDIMRQLHDLYTLRNFCGETKSLRACFAGRRGIPTGAGDCCAPKLLAEAARRNLQPVGLAEFYWGATNPAKTRFHGDFYPACAARCQPLMGFMLCGAAS